MGDVNAIMSGLLGTQCEWEVGGEIEETVCEDFQREFVDQTGGIYRGPEIDQNAREKLFGVSKLKRCKQTVRQRFVVRTFCEYTFS